MFVGRSDLSQGFTSDLGAQMRTVNRIKDSLGLAYDAADIPPGRFPRKRDAAAAIAAQRERHQYGPSTVEVLKNISAALVRSTYPRKAMVYVSEGMTYSLDNAFHRLLTSPPRGPSQGNTGRAPGDVRDARHGGVPVYPIDPRGLPDCTAARGFGDPRGRTFARR